MPMLYGFFKDDAFREGVKKNSDDGYLYSEHLRPGDIVHLFNRWKMEASVKNEFKTVMRERGLSYVDSSDFHLTPSFIASVLSLQIRLILGHLHALFFKGGHDYYLYLVSFLLISAYLEKRLELHNLDYKVEFIKDDYNADHIVSTIACRKAGRKTVGAQHHISAYDFPALAFVHLDHYIVYGDLLTKTFLPWWEHLNLEKTGRETIDWVVSLMNNEKHLRTLKDRVCSLYGSRKWTVLFTLPSGRPLNQPRQWNEVYEALSRLKNTDLDFHLFLRFRNSADLDHYSHLRRFKSLVESEPRFIINHSDFMTHELMAISDMMIGNSTSFSLWEALASNARVFTFDFIGVTKHYFSTYGKDFILETRDDLLRAFQGLENRWAGFDCQWEKLLRDCNYHMDGNNLKRIQDVVNKTLLEAKHAVRSLTPSLA